MKIPVRSGLIMLDEWEGKEEGRERLIFYLKSQKTEYDRAVTSLLRCLHIYRQSSS